MSNNYSQNYVNKNFHGNLTVLLLFLCLCVISARNINDEIMRPTPNRINAPLKCNGVKFVGPGVSLCLDLSTAS